MYSLNAFWVVSVGYRNNRAIIQLSSFVRPQIEVHYCSLHLTDSMQNQYSVSQVWCESQIFIYGFIMYGLFVYIDIHGSTHLLTWPEGTVPEVQGYEHGRRHDGLCRRYPDDSNLFPRSRGPR